MDTKGRHVSHKTSENSFYPCQGHRLWFDGMGVSWGALCPLPGPGLVAILDLGVATPYGPT